MGNSAALRVIFRKKESIFFCFETLFPLYIGFNNVFCLCKEKGQCSGRSSSLHSELCQRSGLSFTKLYGSAFLFPCFFFSSDNFDFKILINYSKASVIVLPLKKAKESR